MTAYTLTVDPDGRVKIPGTEAGETITIQGEREPGAARRATRTLSSAERERIVTKVLEEGRRFREQATPEDIVRAVNHGDWLYDEDGLPR